MLSLPLPGRVFLCTLPTDMRKSFDSLAGLVEQQLGQDPLAGDLFVFRSRRGSKRKTPPFDGGVLFCLYLLYRAFNTIRRPSAAKIADPRPMLMPTPCSSGKPAKQAAAVSTATNPVDAPASASILTISIPTDLLPWAAQYKSVSNHQQYTGGGVMPTSQKIIFSITFKCDAPQSPFALRGQVGRILLNSTVCL